MPSLSDNDPAWFRRALALLAGLFVFRLLYAAIVPMDLAHDEAYYWDWSRRLAWGYYSKPPMTAWLIAVSTSWKASTFSVRLPAVVLGTGGLWFVYLLGARLYHPRVGFWAMLLSAATPGNAAMSLVMTIDAPLMFFWSVSLYCTWRFLEDGPRLRWLAASSVAIGLGLLSKQTMLAFIPLTGLFLLTGAEDRKLWRRFSVWVCPLAALLFLAPVLWWNSQHDWITFQHTRHHFSGPAVGWLKRATRAGEFFLGQFGVISPAAMWLLLVVLASAVRAAAKWGRQERFLLSYCVLPLLGVAALSWTRRVELNWAAPFYVSGMVLLASAVGGGAIGELARIKPRKFSRAVWIGAAFVVLAYAAPFAGGIAGGKLDPVVRLRGWRRLGAEVGRCLQAPPHRDTAFLLVAAGRGPASELAFYLPHQPTVYVWNSSGVVLSQYDLWEPPKCAAGVHVSIVTRDDEAPPAALSAAFEKVELTDAVVVPIGQGRVHRFRLWRAENFRGLPLSPTELLQRPTDR